jgi:hypothetical protein
MKCCPACNFSFPDFHIVCDFDGTELVPDPLRLALIKVPAPRQAFVRGYLTSPKFLTTVAILGLFVSAAAIAFHQTKSRSSRTLLAVNVASPSLNTPRPAATSDSLVPSVSAPVSPGAPAKTLMRTRRASQVRLMDVRNRREHRTEQLSRHIEVAPPPEQAAPQKQQKFVAALKTTWRVLKKPFSF